MLRAQSTSWSSKVRRLASSWKNKEFLLTHHKDLTPNSPKKPVFNSHLSLSLPVCANFSNMPPPTENNYPILEKVCYVF